MSYPAVDKAMQLEGLNKYEKSVVLYLAWCMNDVTGLCCPSVENIASKMSTGRDNTRLAIKTLKAKGLIDYDENVGSARRFRLLFLTTPTKVSTPTEVSTPTKVSTTTEVSRGPILRSVGDPYCPQYPNKEYNKEYNKEEYLSSEKSVDEINDLFSESSGTQEIEPEKVSIKKPVTWQSRVKAEDVMNLYNEILGNTLPALRLLNSNRRTLIKSRLNDLVELWHAGNADEGLDSFKVFFTKVRSSDFLCGRSERGRGHENFKANFDWIMQQKNFTKIIEGNYK